MHFAMRISPYSIQFSSVRATEPGQIHQEKAALTPETFRPSPHGVNLAQRKIKRSVTSARAEIGGAWGLPNFQGLQTRR